VAYSREQRDKAKQLYEKGFTVIQIGDELGIPSGTVSSWRSREKWKQKKRKRAKQKNRKGNPNPRPVIKHGGYSAIYWDSLTPEEQNMVDLMDDSEEKLILDQIRLYSIRERRLMIAIAKYKDLGTSGYESMTTRTEKKREFEDQAEETQYKEFRKRKIDAGNWTPGRGYDLITEKRNPDDMILRLERELTAAQNKKNQAINTLHIIREDRRKLENNNANSIVDDWIKSIMEQEDEETEEKKTK